MTGLLHEKIQCPLQPAAGMAAPEAKLSYCGGGYRNVKLVLSYCRGVRYIRVLVSVGIPEGGGTVGQLRGSGLN